VTRDEEEAWFQLSPKTLLMMTTLQIQEQNAGYFDCMFSRA